MSFNSLAYLLFLPLTVLLYFLIPVRRRWLFLLAASYAFYAFYKFEYLLLILISTGVDYWAGLRMERQGSRGKRRPVLFMSLAVNLGLLFYFKYVDFTVRSANSLAELLGFTLDIPLQHVLLPLGISFYTFQTLSYSIDVYRGARKAERHIGFFALYVTFFPQLVAGPIERSTKLLPQLKQARSFDWVALRIGFQRILVGYFKKLVIADRLAMYVDPVFAKPGQYSSAELLLGGYFFVYQLYCDFSGYTDIAIGSAKMLGVDLSENFNRPFMARSIREYWQRWHMTLTFWIRDYLILPLATLARSRLDKHGINLIALLIIGSWHGANWTFVVFGLLNGLAILWCDVTRPLRDSVAGRAGGILSRTGLPLLSGHGFQAGFRGWMHRVAAFHFVVVCGVFFRSRNIEAALMYLSELGRSLSWSVQFQFQHFNRFEFIIALCAMMLLEIMQWSKMDKGNVATKRDFPPVREFAYNYLLIFFIIIFGAFGIEEFIYFDF